MFFASQQQHTKGIQLLIKAIALLMESNCIADGIAARQSQHAISPNTTLKIYLLF